MDFEWKRPFKFCTEIHFDRLRGSLCAYAAPTADKAPYASSCPRREKSPVFIAFAFTISSSMTYLLFIGSPSYQYASD